MITHNNNNNKKIANAVGGKTARACESCLKRRARWFCAADDAFLCQACDSSVHSANELAGRHTRVRLESKIVTQPAPSWHQGFTKKARTPRSNSNNVKANKPAAASYNNNNYDEGLIGQWNNYEMARVVPEVGNDDEGSMEGNEEERSEAVFSVPNLEIVNNDPFEIKDLKNKTSIDVVVEEDDDDFNISLIGFEGDNINNNSEWDNYLPVGFLPSDNELAEFAADVEGLLEAAAEEGVKGCEEEGDDDGLQLLFPGVKVEEEGDILSVTNDHCYFDWSIDVESEMFNFDLNHSYENNNHDQSQVSGVEENGKKVVVPKHEAAEEEEDEEEELKGSKEMEANNNNNKRRKILLRLNYDEVINAWASQGCLSPWTTGQRPDLNFDHHGWPYCMGGMYPVGAPHPQGEEWMGIRGNANGGDEGREARVSRYREKRRTRLFSKKIRYEVRKLNAEKRPRLKGRFVKRTSLSQVVGVGVEPTF